VAAAVSDTILDAKNRLHMAVETTTYTGAAGSKMIMVCWQGTNQWHDGETATLFYSAQSEHMGNMRVNAQVLCPVELAKYLRTVKSEDKRGPLAWVELSELAASMQQGPEHSGHNLSVVTGGSGEGQKNKEQLANYYQVSVQGCRSNRKSHTS
jgi:hypothetical protein